MSDLLMNDAWRVWATGALSLLPRFEKPENVRIVLDDDTEIPCECTLKGFEAGMTVWRARPAGTVPVERMVELAVDDIPDFCARIDVEVPMGCQHTN